MSYVVEKRNGKWVVDTNIGELIFVRPSTRWGNHIVRAYENSRCVSIYVAYQRPSEWKEDAWRDCKALRDKMRGYGLTITGYNCSTFSAAFKCKLHSYDEDEVIVYITKDYKYCVPVYKRRG